MRQQHIADQHHRQDQPVERGQGHKSKRGSERRNYQPRADGDDDDRSKNQRRAGAALNERNLIRTDNVNNQGLCEKRLDKPACVE